MKTPGLRMGGVGVRRFEAAANHSSEKARMREPRGADMRSGWWLGELSWVGWCILGGRKERWGKTAEGGVEGVGRGEIKGGRREGTGWAYLYTAI